MDIDPFIFDSEVLAHDWLFVFKHKRTKQYVGFHNDSEGLEQFMAYYNPLLAGFNNKHYDQFILKAALMGCTPEEVKEVNDFIIAGNNGWDHPLMRECRLRFDQYDLMDDMQEGLPLKAIEAHLGMDIRESGISFDLDRPLTDAELEELVAYCKADVDATDILDDLRQDYLVNKANLGAEKNIPVERALYMTNAKLTAAYLDAEKRDWADERNYSPPPTLKLQYIPDEVLQFFGRLHDPSIPSEEIFKEKLSITVGGCPCTIAYGGIHGAIPTYREDSTETRTIRNKDVASYYPHQMTLNGYCSRNIPSPKIYEDTISRRVAAKRSGDKATANALKLVLNTTYGAMLQPFNDLYDPLMGRSVCISGQLQLLELAEHLVQDCPSLKIIQLNTDGIMVSLDTEDYPIWDEITREWQERTGFELEEDSIRTIIQKDVNNYLEIAMDGSQKIKGGALVRGISAAGAWNINNNAVVVARALQNYLADGTPIEDTVNGCDRLLDFQLVAKAGHKYAGAFQLIDGEYVPVQNCNRVYACSDFRRGTVYKKNKTTGSMEKIAGLPPHCAIDNDNTQFSIADLDRKWYIRKAKELAGDFLGIKPPKRNTRAVNKIKKNLLEILEV